MNVLAARVYHRLYRTLRCEQIGELLRAPRVCRASLMDYAAASRPPLSHPVSSCVAFDIRNNAFNRYLYVLMLFFVQAGYPVLLKRRRLFLGRLSLYSAEIMKLRDIHLVDDCPQDAALRLCQSIRQSRAEGATCLSEDYFRQGDGASYHVPMCMHPSLYTMPPPARVARFPDREERGIRLFFGGNADRGKYDNPVMRRVFNKLTRVDVIASILSAYAPETTVPATAAEAEGCSRAGILLAMAPAATLGFQEFLRKMGQSSFFLAAPGVTMPLCHNAVEAMFMGAVPVLQYPELFNPPLEDGVNCIAFVDREDLIRRVRDILDMPPARIADLRRGAMAYYDRHLSPESVVRNIMGQGARLRTLYLLSEHGSVKELQRRRKREVKGASNISL